jgi:predicted alpha/beta superfamily hydrolase
MRRGTRLLITIAGIWLLNAGARAQVGDPPLAITFPSAELHRIDSRHVGESFEVRVLLPPTIPGEHARFPVVYMTDATGEMVISDTMMRLMMLADTPRFIAVGIGYPGAKSYFQTMVLRQRDLTQVADVNQRTGASFEGTVVPAVMSGHAAKFLDFMRDELIPFIDGRYPTDPSDRTYAGHSLGGLFGCFALFTHPETFTKYVIGSPSLFWGNGHVFTLAEQYMKTHRDLAARVFIGVGALEEGPDSPMVTNVFRLESLLRAQKYPSLTLTTRVFPDETHLTVWSMNLVRGLVSVFGRPAPENTVTAIYRRMLAASKTAR